MLRSAIMTQIRADTTGMLHTAVRLDHLDHNSPEFARAAEAERQKHRSEMQAAIVRVRDRLRELEESLHA